MNIDEVQLLIVMGFWLIVHLKSLDMFLQPKQTGSN